MEYDLSAFNIAIDDHRIVLAKLKEIIGEENIAPFIRSRMEGILIDYIDCSRGVCYNSKFKELIQPYLNDQELLDKILRSEAIKDKHNVITGKTGAMIFPELLHQLNQCNSTGIRNYLNKEFTN